MTTTATTAAMPSVAPPIDPGVALPLVEWGNLALRAGRLGPIYPHMSWLQRFDSRLSREELQTEIRRIGTTPYGFGRRLVSSRIPAGRSRWIQFSNLPELELEPEPVEDWRAWIDSKLGRRLDPEYDAGWAFLACYTPEGGTVVLVLMHHLFGTARGVMDAIFNGDAHDPLTGSTGLTFTRENNFGLLDEVRGIFQRIRMGFVGAAQLVVAAPRLIRGALSAPAPSAPGLPTPLRGPRGEDPSREPLSDDRVHARYETTSDRLDFIAAHHNGTANTLLTAVCANLLRRARIARGGPIDRPLQLLLPIDLPDEVKRAKLQERGKDPSAEGMMVTAAVVLEGGPPIHGDLALMRARMKEAYIADTKTAPAVRGAGDFLRLFPERVAYFFAAKAAVNFDGCVSNVGELPAEFEYLGDRQATAAEMIGFPIGNEMIAAITRSGGNVAMTFVTDPARMGDESDLRTWLAEELAHWGIDAPIPSTTT